MSVPGLKDVLATMRALYDTVDGVIAKESPAWIPCRAGCSWCCWQMNSLVPWTEAYVLANAIARMPIEERVALTLAAQREIALLRQEPIISQLMDAEHAQVNRDVRQELSEAMAKHVRPCALLDRKSGECRVYADRPLTCRTFGKVVRESRDGVDGYFCTVVQADWLEHMQSGGFTMVDATGAFNASAVIAGGNARGGLVQVWAMPIAMWIDALASGGAKGEWSLGNPEPMFTRALALFGGALADDAEKVSSEEKADG